MLCHNMANEEVEGGFDCEFVEKLPKAIQSECPVCLLVLREPYQATCCGYGFCRVCIERVRLDKNPCPCCKAEEFDCFEDKRLKRSLNDFKVHCTNKKLGCEWVGELGEFESHLNSNPSQDKRLEGCQFTVIDCDVKDIGCEVRVPRKDLSTHLAESLVPHMSLYMKQLMDLKKENKQLKQQGEKLKRDLNAYQIGTPLCPVELTMTDFERHRKDGDHWYSPPFYTHPKGYKLCLWVSARGFGDGANTHVSLFLMLMKGENDEQLKWPFQGKFIIELLSQNGDGRHSLIIKFDMASCSRVIDGELAQGGWGQHTFIPHTELKPTYLQNDCLKFCVIK